MAVNYSVDINPHLSTNAVCKEGEPKPRQFLKRLGKFHRKTSALYLLPVNVF